MTVRPISCAFDRLYPDGAGFPEPDLLPAAHVTQDARLAGIDFVAEIFARETYGSAFTPDIFVTQSAATEAMEPLYRAAAIKTAPPVILAHLARAMTFGAIVYATAGDARIIYETQRINDRAATVPPSRETMAQAVAFPASPSTDYMFLTSAGSFNYGHFLVDDLPRLKSLSVLRARSPGRRCGIVMTSHAPAIDRIRREAVAMIGGPDVEVRFIDHRKAYLFENLYYTSPCSFHPIAKHPAALKYVKDEIEAIIGPCLNRRRRLFVGRPATGSRQLLNRDKVARWLAAHGYQQVYPERMAFVKQARLFASADRLIGQMGAAMTNTLFCPAGSDLIYLAPEGWSEPFYWDLAMIGHQRYRIVYGTSPSEPMDAAHLRDFRIDPADLSGLVADGTPRRWFRPPLWR